MTQSLPTTSFPIAPQILGVFIVLASMLVVLSLPWPFLFVLFVIGIVYIRLILVKAKTIRDQTNARHNEQLREQHERDEAATLMKLLIDAADIPIMATDDQGCITHSNRNAQQMLRLNEDIIGLRFDELFTQQVLHDLEKHAREGEQGHARLSFPIAGEMREFDVSADPVIALQYKALHGAVLTFRDITELSLAMTLKADFVANASHELRTPIASIKGAAETLAGPARNDDGMSARLIEMITNNATRLELLASDLLDLSRLEAQDQSPELQSIDLSDLIAKIIHDSTQAATRRKLKVVSEISSEIDLIHTDPMLLSLILRNLVQNAIKFAHEETTIKVAAEVDSITSDRTVSVPSSLDGTMGVRIRVVDKGIGIPLTQQQRIFERFFQVDDARSGSSAKRGTGLGLAIVKHASKRLGGAVSLESVYQEGSTFIIELPRCIHGTPE